MHKNNFLRNPLNEDVVFFLFDLFEGGIFYFPCMHFSLRDDGLTQKTIRPSSTKLNFCPKHQQKEAIIDER
jgi:hypothetical protein